MLSHDAMPFMTHEKHFFGMFDGMMAAERIGTGGNVAGGLLVGVLTGLIGTGIGYLIIGPANIDVNALAMMEGGGSSKLEPICSIAPHFQHQTVEHGVRRRGYY
jgi:hypothetical protein